MQLQNGPFSIAPVRADFEALTNGVLKSPVVRNAECWRYGERERRQRVGPWEHGANRLSRAQWWTGGNVAAALLMDLVDPFNSSSAG